MVTFGGADAPLCGGEVWIFGGDGGASGTCVGVALVGEAGDRGVGFFNGGDAADVAFAGVAEGGAAALAPPGSTGDFEFLRAGFINCEEGILVSVRARYCTVNISIHAGRKKGPTATPGDIGTYSLLLDHAGSRRRHPGDCPDG